MKKKCFILILLIQLCIAFPFWQAANPNSSRPLDRVAEYFPEKPKEGETVHIVYHAGHAESKFSPRETLYAVFVTLNQDNSFKYEGMKMAREGNNFFIEKKIKQNSAVVITHFLTLSPGSVDFAEPGLRVMVYGKDSRPVRNACAGMMGIANYKEKFQEEIANYPDNYGAYRDMWFYTSMDLGNNAMPLVTADMRKLEGIDQESIGLWFSLSYGYLLQKNEPKSREMLLKILSKDPSSFYLVGAISSYYIFSEIYRFPTETVRQVDEAINRAVDLQPEAPAWRWLLIKGILKCPLAQLQKICVSWIAIEKENPFPYALLAERLNTENVELEKAAQLIDQAIQLVLTGHLRFYFDIMGKYSDIFLPQYYQTAAEIHLKLHDYNRAFACIKSVQSLTASDAKAAFTEGEIWMNLGNMQTAKKSFLEAWRLGHKGAKDQVRAIWELSELQPGDFETWFAGQTKAKTEAQQTNPSGKKHLTHAPTFSGKDISGKMVASSTLLGKTVVLNFWFTTCSPCKAEIADLNQLVAEFKDVVFLAVALDDAKTIKSFLKEFPFHYRILPDPNKEIIKKFAIKAFPSHFVIDPKGSIFFQRLGAGSGVYQELSTVLKRMLGKE